MTDVDFRTIRSGMAVAMSAASPFVCCDVGTPPTASFSSGQRYPLLTGISIPRAVRNGCRTLMTSACMLSRTLAVAITLTMPRLSAVSLFSNSEKEKSLLIVPILVNF